jgi:hypothetical protein
MNVPGKESSAGECTVTLTSSDCYSSSPNIVECYSVTWNGGSDTYFIYVKTAPYGVGTGYNISYSKNGKSSLMMAQRTFETKKEAISDFVKNVIGSSCRYVYE